MPEDVKKDIRFAYEQITTFAKAQRDSIKDFEIVTPAGVRAGQKVIPMDVAGCYVPGGRFAHTCSALMSIATAKVAGVPFVVAATPPRGNSIDPSVCYAMDLAGADVILEMGGIQSVATMAYGLFTGKKANIIAGPGNAFVAETKAMLAGEGTVDGEGNNWEHLVLAKHIEVLKGAMDSQHNYSMHLLMMSKKKFDALDPQAQAVIREAAKEALAYERTLTEELKQKCEQEMLAQGIIIYRLSPEERAALKEKTQVVWDEFKNEIDPKVLQMVLDTQT